MSLFRKRNFDSGTREKYIIAHYQDVDKFVRSMVENPYAAEDITQTVMLIALQKQHQLKDPSRSKSWLMKIAYHTSIDFFRLNKRETFDFSIEADTDNIPDHASDILENLVKDLESEILKASLNRMDDKFRTLIMMRFDEDLSIKDISEILGIKEGTITSYICRGLKKLRLIYEEIERGESPDGTKLERARTKV